MDFNYNDYLQAYANPTEALNQCILDASGKGRVYISSGEYCLGTIHLVSNTHIYIEKGAILKASDDIADFGTGMQHMVQIPTYIDCSYNGNPTLFFFKGEHIENVTLEGEGTIDGNEEIFYGEISPYQIDGKFYPRVPMFYFEDVYNLKLKGLTLTHSAFWTVHMVGCKKVHIDGLEIMNNRILANCDGIDPDHCQNVLIENCIIRAADDCIVFKTTEANKKYGPCQDIEVRNCKLSSTSAAVKFGTESVSNFAHIYIHDIEITDTNRGISMQLRDEGNISDVRFENITIETHRVSTVHWWGKAEPIAITAVPRKEDTKIGNISNISLENIHMIAENGIVLYGEDNISNVVLRQSSLKLVKLTDWPVNILDLRPSIYGYFDHKDQPITQIGGRLELMDFLVDGKALNIS